jgi:hypothetical protein
LDRLLQRTAMRCEFTVAGGSWTRAQISFIRGDSARPYRVSRAREAPLQFLLIISHGPDFQATPELVGAIHEWISGSERDGIRVHGNPLRPPSEAVTVRVRDGKLVRSTGPAASGEEMIAAYELIECADTDAAVEIAAQHPMARAATIEIRPVWEALRETPT